jgi:predicted amidohydrolase YtcJ
MAPFVLINAKIVTVDDRFSIVEAVAIDGERITATGSNADVLAYAGPGVTVVDLDGMTVIPGLIDNHNHFVRASEHAEVRLDGARTRAQALDALRSAVRSLPAGQWLVALGGWHEEQWVGDRREFTVAELDAVAGGRPAFVMAEYDHAVFNTAWLDAMGVSADAETRATGRIGGGIVALNRAVGAVPVPAEREATAKAAASWYNSVGLTTVFDPGGVGVPAEAYATVASLAERGELTLRVLTTLGDGASGRGPGHAAVMAERLRDCRPFEGDHWHDRIALGEIYYAAFHWDHPGVEPSPTEEDIAGADEILAAAASTGWPVQTHSVTTAGLDLVFDAYERADRVRPIRPLRWTVTHAEGITPVQIERARRLGVVVQLRSMGVIRANKIAPVPLRLIADSGLSWGLGTDGTRAAQINPFVALWWAVTGQSMGGSRIQDETLSREEALIAHTRSNAYLMFRESHLGSIRPGLLADLLVLDRDYLTVPVDEIRDIRPVATMVGGQVVHGTLAPHATRSPTRA